MASHIIRVLPLKEILPFVYATVYPFISSGSGNDGDDEDISDDEDMHGLEVSKSSAVSKRKRKQVYQQIKQ